MRFNIEMEGRYDQLSGIGRHEVKVRHGRHDQAKLADLLPVYSTFEKSESRRRSASETDLDTIVVRLSC